MHSREHLAADRGDRVAKEHAAIALGRIGPAAEAAIPALTKALEDDNRWVRDQARKALERIDPDAR